MPAIGRENMQKVLDLIRHDVAADKVQIDNPTQNLESYFLDVVRKAKESLSETSGATSGSRVAAYLRGDAEAAARGRQDVGTLDCGRAQTRGTHPDRRARAKDRPIQTGFAGQTGRDAGCAAAARARRSPRRPESSQCEAFLFAGQAGREMNKIATIVGLTWKAAFRYRLFWVLCALLAAAVVGLPLMIKDDGTAKGMVQILLTYTLSATATILGFATLWLSCGTLAKDVEECQIQMVAVKPIARWQIWLGKWLGLLSLNAVLLALAGASIFLTLQWRAGRLAPDQQKILREDIFVSRASAKEPPPEPRPVVDHYMQKGGQGPLDALNGFDLGGNSQADHRKNQIPLYGPAARRVAAVGHRPAHAQGQVA